MRAPGSPLLRMRTLFTSLKPTMTIMAGMGEVLIPNRHISRSRLSMIRTTRYAATSVEV
jgi:hypothetical protein